MASGFDEKFSVIQTLVPYIECIVFLWLLSRLFFFVFSFIVWFWCGWAWLSPSLSFLLFTKLLESVTLSLSSNFKSFQPLFLQKNFFFCTTLSRPSYWDSGDKNVRPFGIVPWVLKDLFIFFNLFPFYCSTGQFVLIYLYWFMLTYWTIFKFTDFSIICILLLSSSN